MTHKACFPSTPDNSFFHGSGEGFQRLLDNPLLFAGTPVTLVLFASKSMDSSALWLAIVYKEQKIVLSHKQASYIIVEGNLFWIIEINGKHVSSGVIFWPVSYENI